MLLGLSPPINKKILPIKPPSKPPNVRLAKTNARWVKIRKLHTEKRHACEAIAKAIKEAMLDSEASSHFIQSGEGMKLTRPSSTAISTANRGVMYATGTVELPPMTLKQSAKQAINAPELKTKTLMSLSELADAGYTTSIYT